MDPVTLLVVSGLLGGLVLAFLAVRFRRRREGIAAPYAFTREPLSSDVINMARIRVAGVGGLGLVAMALWVAWFVPRIGQTLAVGLVFGCVLALILITRRRRDGALPSSGRQAGANTTLSIDAAPASSEDTGEKRSSHPCLHSDGLPVPLH